MSSLFDEIPCEVVIFYLQEWEDYGLGGFGDANGQPTRTGYYLSSDWEGCDVLMRSLREKLEQKGFDTDKAMEACRVVSSWLQSVSWGIASMEDLVEVFNLEPEPTALAPFAVSEKTDDTNTQVL